MRGENSSTKNFLCDFVSRKIGAFVEGPWQSSSAKNYCAMADQMLVQPPSMLMACPDMKADSSEAR